MRHPLGRAGDIGGKNRHGVRHRLADHIRKAIAVAGGRHHASEQKQICLRIQCFDLRILELARKRHMAPQTEFCNFSV